MTHRRGHRRSPEAMLRRAARRYVMLSSYRDHEQAETVSKVSREDVLEHLSSLEIDGVLVGAVPDVEKGLVLLDRRGRGSFQLPLVPETLRKS